MLSTKSNIKKQVDVFQSLINKGGPQKTDYKLLNATIDDLGNSLKNKEITKEDLIEIYNLFDDDFMEQAMVGHALKKPFGYAGDFMIIDKTYQHYTSEKYRLWDEFTQNQIAVQAVRNRKKYFKTIMKEKHRERNNFSLLNLASGPARDLLELYQEIENPNIKTHCIEYDPKAIEYAKSLTHKFSAQIEFEHANIYKYECVKKFDVIWYAGLFDYFDDKAFIRILKNLLTWTNEGFEIIIGNLTSNPSQYYLEILGEWYLHYRNEDDLIAIANQAGISNHRIEIKQEEAGVNLFLHIK